MVINDIHKEFQELIDIAQNIILNNETKELVMDDFLQLCLDIRKNERIPLDISSKNLVMCESAWVQ